MKLRTISLLALCGCVGSGWGAAAEDDLLEGRVVSSGTIIGLSGGVVSNVIEPSAAVIFQNNGTIDASQLPRSSLTFINSGQGVPTLTFTGTLTLTGATGDLHIRPSTGVGPVTLNGGTFSADEGSWTLASDSFLDRDEKSYGTRGDGGVLLISGQEVPTLTLTGPTGDLDIPQGVGSVTLNGTFPFRNEDIIFASGGFGTIASSPLVDREGNK